MSNVLNQFSGFLSQEEISPQLLGNDSAENSEASSINHEGNSKLMSETKESIGVIPIIPPSSKAYSPQYLRTSDDHSALEQKFDIVHSVDTPKSNKNVPAIIYDQFILGAKYAPNFTNPIENSAFVSTPKPSYDHSFKNSASTFSSILPFNASKYSASKSISTVKHLDPIAPPWHGRITPPNYEKSKSFDPFLEDKSAAASFNIETDKNFKACPFSEEAKFILDILTPPGSPNRNSNSSERSSKVLDEDTLCNLAHHFFSLKEERSKEQQLSVAQESNGVLYFQPGAHQNQNKYYYGSQFPLPPHHSEFSRGQASVLSAPSKFGNFWGGAPSRWLCVGNLPKDINIWTLSQIIQAQGDVNDIFVKFLATHGFIYVVFYDIRDAMKAHRQLQGQSIYGKRLVVQFCARPFSKQTSRQDDSESWEWDNEGVLILKPLGQMLGESSIMKEFELYGDIRAFKKLTEENKQMILIEYYDTRDAFCAKEILNGKIIWNAAFQLDYYNHGICSWQMLNKFLEKKDQKVNDRVISDHSYDASLSLNSSADSPNNEIRKSSKNFQSRELFYSQNVRGADLKNSFAGSAQQIGVSSENSRVSFSSESDSNSEETKIFLNISTRTDSIKQVEDEDSSTRTNGRASKRLTGPNNSTVVTSGDRTIPAKNTLDLEKISTGEDQRTTFMIRNIPNKYTQRMLLETLDETHKGQYDFVYLRMDFKNRCNVGYAFINFVDANAVLSFAKTRVGKRWSRFNSDKVCELAYANIQGKVALVEKFRNSSVMEELPEYRPKIFSSSGSSRGKEELFPLPNDPQRKWRSLAGRSGITTSI
ncbi:hypothetical protein G9A89_000913 [Geosiphon pyriformis]|nr:hypothetical protein G9A89_000913 [Geosiphon pyriformis]